jgi:hypothetical protein
MEDEVGSPPGFGPAELGDADTFGTPLRDDHTGDVSDSSATRRLKSLLVSLPSNFLLSRRCRCGAGGCWLRVSQVPSSKQGKVLIT